MSFKWCCICQDRPEVEKDYGCGGISHRKGHGPHIYSWKSWVQALVESDRLPTRAAKPKIFSWHSLAPPVQHYTWKNLQKLEDVSFLSITMDLWSSRTMQPYLSLTAHCISKEWNLENVCLQTSFFSSDHTSKTIAQGLRDSMDSWNLSEDRLVCTTTDSGSNMIKALSLNEWPSLQCFGYKLHNGIGV